MLTIKEIELIEKVLGDRQENINETKSKIPEIDSITKEMGEFIINDIPESFRGIAQMKMAVVKKQYEEFLNDESAIIRLRAKLLDLKEEILLNEATKKL